MILKHLVLQNFRSYTNSTFNFSPSTVIVGKNTAGKTNILEGIHFLSYGRSFRAEKDVDTIKMDETIAKIEAGIEESGDRKRLTIAILKKNDIPSKRFFVNNIPKRQTDFISHFYSVLFVPTDIEIITDSPDARRKYFDRILSKSDKAYRAAGSIYDKALRQRNRMLQDVKDGRKNYKKSDFEYWDNLLIENGSILTDTRKQLVEFFNNKKKKIFDFIIAYDKSVISRERLDTYFDTELKVGMTLVGPQRDEFLFFFPSAEKTIKEFGSRGEQRLAIFQMKILEVAYLKMKNNVSPVVLLDDIFSELDEENIHKVLNLLPQEQTIITTTHKEFIPERILGKKDLEIIEL